MRKELTQAQFESAAQSYRDAQLDRYLNETCGDSTVMSIEYRIEVRKTAKFAAKAYSSSMEVEAACGFEIAEALEGELSRLWRARHVTYTKSPVTGKGFFVYDAKKPKPYYRYSEGMDFVMVRYGEFMAKLTSVSEVDSDGCCEPDWESMAEDRAEAAAERFFSML